MTEEASAEPRRPDEHGVPDPFPLMHPLMKKNYGEWDWHDRLRPGVLHHVAKNGDEIWTVRAGTQRQMDVYTIRKLCDIADTLAEGHVRFTTRSNIEFMVSKEDQVAPLIEKLEDEIATLRNEIDVIKNAFRNELARHEVKMIKKGHDVSSIID